MKRLSVNIRFILSIVIFCFPIISLVFYLWQGNQETVNFSKKELEGVDHLISGTIVKEESLNLHFRSLKENVNSDEWTALEKKWELYFQEIEDVEFDKAKAKSVVKSYINSSSQDKASGKALYDALVGLKFVREAIADTHNIMLDPDSDTYYLMDNMITWIPSIHEIEAKAIMYAAEAQKGSLSEDQLRDIYHVKVVLGEITEKILLNFSKVKQFDSQYYGESAEVIKNIDGYESKIKKQSEALNSVLAEILSKQQIDGVLISRVVQEFVGNSSILNGIQKDFRFMVAHRVDELNNTMKLRLGVSSALLIFAILFSAYLAMTVNQTVGAFGAAVVELKAHSEKSIRVRDSLLGASKSVADSSATQAAAIEETSASLEELSSIVKTNAANSLQAQDIAQIASQKVEVGVKDVDVLQNNMDAISGSAKKIEEIMQIIDDIAFQTNLLALNASVEAARAGEHGKGFAVVADAVRSLAQRSANSAKEIGTLIQDSLSSISKGKQSADSVNDAMKEILESIKKVTSLNTEIAHASQEQSAGILQISTAINDLERSTMENSGVAVKASEYSKEAMNQAEGLMRIVSVLDRELRGMNSADSTAVLTEFKADEAIAAHLKWKVRLKDFIDGRSSEQLQSVHVCKDDQCALGQWIYGQGVQFAQLSSYENLKVKHAQFHKAAGSVLKAVESGNKQSALQMLGEGNAFDVSTEATVEAIRLLDRDIKNA